MARRFGAGEHAGAVRAGIDGLWLALALGVVLAVVGSLATPWLVSLFGADAAVSEQAVIYLQLSMWGLLVMLIVFAATGLLRGMQDTVTPLWIAGSASAPRTPSSTGCSSTGSAGASPDRPRAPSSRSGRWSVRTPSWWGGWHGGTRHPCARSATDGAARRAGGWLFLRTVSLRIAFLATVWVATALGTDELAGWQVAFTIFSTAAFALDALAIAAQALVGRGLGAGDEPFVRRVLGRTVAWGAWFGVLVGGVIAALSGVIGLVFTGSADVAALVQPALLVLAVAQPVCGVVFVLDGVLMGAGDARFLAIAGGINLIPYFPALAAVWMVHPTGATGLAWLAVLLRVYMLARLGTLGWRVRSAAWLTAGA